MIWSILIFLLVLGIDLYTDFKRFKSGQIINHVRGLILRILGLTPSVLLLPHDRLLGAFIEGLLYLTLFNGLWGLFIKKDWFYLGSTSKLDIFQKKLGVWGYILQYGLLVLSIVIWLK